MKRSEALSLVAVLQAAFPAGSAGRETAELYATKLEACDATLAAKAVDKMILTRREPFLPTWAEIQDWLDFVKPSQPQLPHGENGITYKEFLQLKEIG